MEKQHSLWSDRAIFPTKKRTRQHMFYYKFNSKSIIVTINTQGAHRLEKCLNFNPSAWKVLEFVIGLEKEQNA